MKTKPITEIEKQNLRAIFEACRQKGEVFHTVDAPMRFAFDINSMLYLPVKEKSAGWAITAISAAGALTYRGVPIQFDQDQSWDISRHDANDDWEQYINDKLRLEEML